MLPFLTNKMPLFDKIQNCLINFWNTDHPTEEVISLKPPLLKEVLDQDNNGTINSIDYSELRRLGVFGERGHPFIFLDQFLDFAKEVNQRFYFHWQIENNPAIGGQARNIFVDDLMTAKREVFPELMPDSLLVHTVFIFLEGWNSAHFEKTISLTPVIAGDLDFIRPGETISFDDYDYLKRNGYFGDPRHPSVSAQDFFRLARYLKVVKGYANLPPVGNHELSKMELPAENKSSPKKEAPTTLPPKEAKLHQEIDAMRDLEKEAINQYYASKGNNDHLEMRLECTDMIFDALAEAGVKEPSPLTPEGFIQMQNVNSAGSAKNWVRLLSEKLDACLDSRQQEEEEQMVIHGLKLLQEKREKTAGAQRCALFFFPYWMEAGYKLSKLGIEGDDIKETLKTPGGVVCRGFGTENR